MNQTFSSFRARQDPAQAPQGGIGEGTSAAICGLFVTGKTVSKTSRCLSALSSTENVTFAAETPLSPLPNSGSRADKRRPYTSERSSSPPAVVLEVVAVQSAKQQIAHKKYQKVSRMTTDTSQRH
mmetsp:Transcript_5098/g.11336  ORF Transcript_5098/g.11336 Transcript_5098/m.11336 type:complete len:125 (-) Transcript_5098:1803-2177(-)